MIILSDEVAKLEKRLEYYEKAHAWIGGWISALVDDENSCIEARYAAKKYFECLDIANQKQLEELLK